MFIKKNSCLINRVYNIIKAMLKKVKKKGLDVDYPSPKIKSCQVSAIR